MECVILSSWDHIMGPQIERLWLINNRSSVRVSEMPNNTLKDFNVNKHYKGINNTLSAISNLSDLKLYSMMCGQLLLGEVDSCKPFEEWASRLYTSEYKILVTLVFVMNAWPCLGISKEVKNVTLCLGAIFKCEDLNFVLNHHHLIDLHLRKVVNVFQKAKVLLDTTLNEIYVIVKDLAVLLSTLHETNFEAVKIHSPMTFEDSFISSILPQAIVSHLQTSGCTAVIGSSEFIINKIVRILASFTSESESCCSLPVTDFSSMSYIQGLYIQGTIKSTEKQLKYLIENAFKESRSLTVIDTDVFKVWQTIAFSDSATKNKDSCLVLETGSLVPQLLKDLVFIEKNKGDCRRFIDNFYKFLMVKCASLIKAVDHFRQSGKLLSKTEAMTMFAVNSVADLQILLGSAEKIKPGIRVTFL